MSTSQRKAGGSNSGGARTGASLSVEEYAARIAGLLATILGVDGITADSNFFKVKGDSLAAVTLTIAVEETFGVKLDPVDIFEHPHLRDYARLVASAVELGLGK